MIRRAAPDGDSTSAHLAALEARIDQAQARIREWLKRCPGNRELCDALLDIRNDLNPPRRT